MRALVRAWSRDGPPSTRYDARVNGAPANPMSGVPPSSARSASTAARTGATSSGSRSRSWPRSARVRIGRAMTGPTPGLMSRSMPTALSGTTMSLKKMAASTPYRRTGCRVISTTRSVRKHESSIAVPCRTARYSGSERPACRMNHTGVCATGSRRQAARKAESASGSGVCVRSAMSPPRMPGIGPVGLSRCRPPRSAATPTRAAATPYCCTRASRSPCRNRASRIVATG